MLHFSAVDLLLLLVFKVAFAARQCCLELGRYRFFKSVSVFGFLVGFFKSRYRFRCRFFKISRYRFRFFRTNLPLLIE